MMKTKTGFGITLGPGLSVRVSHWEILYTGYTDGCAEILCPKWAAFCVQKSGIAYFILIVYTM